MKKTLTMLFATTALTAAIAIPAWSAMQIPASGSGAAPMAAALDATQNAAPLILVDGDSDDDDDNSGNKNRSKSRSGDDDDSDDDDDDDDSDDDDDDSDDDDDCGSDRGACGAAQDPAPGGTVSPPRNGLFGNGAAPKVQVN